MSVVISSYQYVQHIYEPGRIHVHVCEKREYGCMGTLEARIWMHGHPWHDEAAHVPCIMCHMYVCTCTCRLCAACVKLPWFWGVHWCPCAFEAYIDALAHKDMPSTLYTQTSEYMKQMQIYIPWRLYALRILVSGEWKSGRSPALFVDPTCRMSSPEQVVCVRMPILLVIVCASLNSWPVPCLAHTHVLVNLVLMNLVAIKTQMMFVCTFKDATSQKQRACMVASWNIWTCITAVIPAKVCRERGRLRVSSSCASLDLSASSRCPPCPATSFLRRLPCFLYPSPFPSPFPCLSPFPAASSLFLAPLRAHLDPPLVHQPVVCKRVWVLISRRSGIRSCTLSWTACHVHICMCVQTSNTYAKRADRHFTEERRRGVAGCDVLQALGGISHGFSTQARKQSRVPWCAFGSLLCACTCGWIYMHA